MHIPEPSFVTVDRRKIAYTEVSPPDPEGTILLLTGLASKRLGWYQQIEIFSQRYRTIAVDHRDVGDSDLAAGPYTTADQADDAAAVLRALGVERAHVVGISMGGFIALELTLRHPELVEKLVLVATSAGGRGHTQPSLRFKLMAWALLLRLAKSEPGERTREIYTRIMARGYAERYPSVMDRIAEIGRYRPISPAAYNRQLQAIRRYDVSRRLREIQAPTLVIHGEDDPLVPAKNGRDLARAIKDARLIIYPDTGHIPIIERAEEFNGHVLAFLGDESRLRQSP